MFLPDTSEDKNVSSFVDVYTKQFFEFILPELSRSVKQYYPAGPMAIRFVTGDGHAFHFSIISPMRPDPYEMEWKLICLKGFYKRETAPSFD